MTIWKFPLIVKDSLELKMPIDAKILTVQVQNSIPCLWAIVNPEKAKETRRFRVAVTGDNPGMEEAIFNAAFGDDGMKYIGTFQLAGGSFIGHLFEV